MELSAGVIRDWRSQVTDAVLPGEQTPERAAERRGQAAERAEILAAIDDLRAAVAGVPDEPAPRTGVTGLLEVEDLDNRATLAAVEALVRTRRRHEVDDLLLLGHFCVLNATEPPLRRPGGDRLETIGGEGTPAVRQLAITELAIAREVHYNTMRSMVADALDLAHRLPRVWAKVRDLSAEPYVARRVAYLTRHLTKDQAARVDLRVARCIATQAPGRVFDVTEAAIKTVDPEGEEARVIARRLKKFVALGKISPEGLRSIVARVTAGDAAYVEATLVRAADLLATKPEHEGRTRDELRAIAFGYLGRPAELLALLLEHTDPDADDDAWNPIHHDPEPGYTDHDQGRPYLGNEDDDNNERRTRRPTPHSETESPEPEPEPEPDEPGEDEAPLPTPPNDEPDRPGWRNPVDEDEPDFEPVIPDPALCRPLAFPAELLATLHALGLTRLRAQAILYVHAHHDVLTGTVDGVARVEGIGSMTLEELRELLGTRNITLTPVIDAREMISTAAYEHPPAIRERVLLRKPGDQFPYAVGMGRTVDLDHPVPYDPNGPPDQTSTHTGNPLTRTGHRAKTYLGYYCTPTTDGTGIVWDTPHGLRRIVDAHGTHHPRNYSHLERFLARQLGLN